MHHHDVRGPDLILDLDEVSMLPRQATLHPVLRRQRFSLRVVLLRELDDGRFPRAGLQELDVDGAHSPSHLEHRRVGDPALRKAIHHQAGGLVEALAPVAARVALRQALTEDFPVAGSTAGAHGREVYDPRVRILIAEDETIIRLDLKDLLERSGFEVCAEAKDGLEAVELARSEQPDLAVLDVKMPRLDGIETARRILDERPIPIVMLTAYGQDELVSRAIEAGVFGYLVKPFREQDLLPAIRTARARHEELTALREQADSLAEALAARKAIERAKGLLMERESLTEEEAFARLRKASQVSGRPMKVVAEAVVATFEADA
jgi:AmiR/NasT family two-component response regulator